MAVSHHLFALPVQFDTLQVVLLMIGGGGHFDDMDRAHRRRRIRQYASEAEASHQQLPRDRLHDLIAEANLSRPVPIARQR